jgi:hypothetical protein
LECRGQYSSSPSCSTLGLYIVCVQNHMHTQQPKQTHTHTHPITCIDRNPINEVNSKLSPLKEKRGDEFNIFKT